MIFGIFAFILCWVNLALLVINNNNNQQNVPSTTLIPTTTPAPPGLTSTDRLIEIGSCKFLNGILPYEYHVIELSNNVTSYYVEFLPTNTNFTVSTTGVTPSITCPTPNFRISENFYFFDCTLDPTGTNFTIAQINLRVNYVFQIRNLNITNEFEYNVPATASYHASGFTNPSCMKNSVAFDRQPPFGAESSGIFIGLNVYTSVPVTSVRLVNKLKIVLP